MAFSNPRYGLVAKALHWIVVLLIAAQFTVGFVMPEIHRGVEVEFWIGLHLSLGVLIILVIAFRVVWRVLHPVLALTTLPKWQQQASHATHGMLYLLLIVAPLLGWANASSRGWDVGLFGLFPLPRLTAEGSAIGGAAGDVHIVAVYAMLALIGLHMLAALYHHFVQRDQVLREML
jgi:cytochrome b561